VGIWPHTGGELLLDARPLSTWNREELGPHIGYLPQEVELFEGSIAENIARMAEVDSNQVVVAARMAGLHELILRMPKGYDTPIGEAGRLLSGGQRQRIALARALYGDPQILVLDEPNANLDDQGERALMQALVQAKAQGKTIVLISHRTAAVQLADNLLVLKDGRVQAQGPRNTLIPAAPEPRTA
jgi:ATP-binding cassette subfamily C exporter for protease/lipase